MNGRASSVNAAEFRMAHRYWASAADPAQPPPDLPRRRRDVAGGGQDALQPDQEIVGVLPGRRELVGGALPRRARLRRAGHADAPPAGAVGEDADVAAAGLLLPGRQVVGKLLDRVGQDAPRLEIAIDLDEATADLDVDP